MARDNSLGLATGDDSFHITTFMLSNFYGGDLLNKHHTIMENDFPFHPPSAKH